MRVDTAKHRTTARARPANPSRQNSVLARRGAAAASRIGARGCAEPVPVSSLDDERSGDSGHKRTRGRSCRRRRDRDKLLDRGCSHLLLDDGTAG